MRRLINKFDREAGGFKAVEVQGIRLGNDGSVWVKTDLHVDYQRCSGKIA